MFVFLILLGAALATFSGCDSTELDPFQNDGKYFTVYGFLDERESNHAIRVIPLSRLAEKITDPSDPQASIDAVVTTTDTLTGNTIRWNHSLDRFSDGSYGHIYRSSFQVRPNRVYRLEITRNDGITTWAETRVPSLFSTHVERSSPLVTQDSSVFLDFVLPGVPSPWNVEVAYWMGGGAPIRISHGRSGSATDNGGWQITIDVAKDVELLGSILQRDEENIFWAAMGIRAQVLDDNWDPPLDIFDPEVLSIPGTLSNVVNGYGFFGSIGLLQDDWPVSQEFVDVMEFCLIPNVANLNPVFFAEYCSG